MTYVDGFVFAVSKKNVPAYKKLATLANKVWREHGAIDYKECMIDQKAPKHITLTFAKLLKQKKDETIWFSFVVYPSRKDRDRINKVVMKDPRFTALEKTMPVMPFDMKRMASAGFKTIVE